MSIHNRTLSATAAMPLPSGKSAHHAVIEGSLKGELSGDVQGLDILESLDLLGKDMGTIQLAWGFSDNLVFFKKEDGSIGYEQIYSAGWYPVSLVRKVIAHAVTVSKYMPDSYRESLPSLSDVLLSLAACQPDTKFGET